MKMSTLQKILKFNIKGCIKNFSRCQSTEISKIARHNQFHLPILTEINKNPWIWQQNTSIESPISRIVSTELPTTITKIPFFDPLPLNKIEIEAPSTDESKYEKQAVKLIVIRRHKMRKHKLKKLRKKMKFEWAKRRQRREMKKEKLFQGQLLSQIKEAENFSAEQYVAEKLQKATEIPIPRFWKGRRLPEYLIREKLGLPPK